MNTNRKPVLVWLTVLAAACYAQFGRAAYDDVGVGARVTGMGNAFTAVADDVYAVYYNPAGLATLERPMLATSYSKLLGGLSDNSNLQNSFIAYEHPIQEGRQGTYGLAWNYFTLDSLYREMSLSGSYGRALFAKERPGQFYAGGTLKYLNRSLGNTSAATQPLGNTGIVQPGTVDPVLQDASRGNVDVDLGFLYRPKPRWTVGLMIQHLMEPNVAFSASDTDKLGRNIKLGGSYKTPFSTLSSDFGFVKAPDGSTDKQISFAAEKWLPTLMHGTFGVRSGLAVGDRSYRTLTAGVSYKIYRLQFDYGFGLPLGGVSKTYGTHRLGMTFHFGRPKVSAPTATYGEAVLENLRELSEVGTPEFKYQMEDLALFKRTAIEEFLRQAKVDVGAGRFADALDKVQQALSMKPNDAKISASQDRLKAVAQNFPEVRDFATDAAQAAVYEGLLEFLVGSDRQALRKLAYAQSLSPADERIEAMLQVVESKAGVVRDSAIPAAPKAAPTMGAEKAVGGALALMEVSLREREWDKVLKFAAQVLELDPANSLAYKRVAAARYAKGQHAEALAALRNAYKHETDPEARKGIRSYIDAMSALIEKKTRDAQPRIEEERPRARTPQDIERLYEAGVDLYAQGRLSEAAGLFQKILEADPNNVSAKRALDRIQAEMLQGGKR